MLRGLAVGRDEASGARCERGQQTLYVAIAAHGAEPAAGIRQGRADAAQQRLAVAPTFDVRGELRDRAVQLLDRVGRVQRAIQRVIKTRSMRVSVLSSPSRKLAAAPGCC
jgi:hypothetical protein